MTKNYPMLFFLSSELMHLVKKFELLFILVVIFSAPIATIGQTQLGPDIDGVAAVDQSGYSVSSSSDGTRVAVGSPYNDGNGNNSGHVRIYETDGTNWLQLGTDIQGEALDDESGYSVSISSDGTRVAIGAPHNDGNGADSGQVRIYEYNGANWIQLGLDIDGEAAGDNSGISVTINSDGSRVAIGASLNDGNGFDSGHVRVFDYDGSNWIQVGSDIDGVAAGDYSGGSVSLNSDGNTLAIGANRHNNNRGLVKVYKFDGTNWVVKGSNSLIGVGQSGVQGTYFGSSVSLNGDGNTLAVGVPNYGRHAGNILRGRARIFEYNEINDTWDQLGQSLLGENTYDFNGSSVSISSDGTRVAVGARANDGNGSNSGHVRIYQYNGTNWEQSGCDIDGEAAGDNSGFSVSMSTDGTKVAIGARLNDGNGSDSGHTRVYNLLTTSASLTPASCSSNADGAIDLEVTGGTAPYTFVWSNSATTEDLENLSTGVYSVTITDANNCVTTDSFSITVEDNTAPTVITQNISVNLDENGTASIEATDVDNSSNDNCSIANLALDISTFDCSSLGENTVTLTATDASGNESTATAIVSVQDVNAPSFANVNDIDVGTNGTSEVVNFTSTTISDNCVGNNIALDNYPSTPSGFTKMGVFNGHTYFISNTTDTYGNFLNSISLINGAYPVSITSAAENSFIATYLSENAQISALIGLNDLQTEGTFVWENGENVSYTNWITGEPNDSGGEDIGEIYNGEWNDISNSANYNPIIIEFSYAVEQTAGLASGSAFPVGTTVNTFRVFDESGNSTTASFNVTVNDTQEPSVTSIDDQNSCPNEVVQVQTSISDNFTSLGDLVISASSSNQSIIPDANIAISNTGNDFEIDLTPVSDVEGDATITISVTDEANNVATEIFNVNINPSPGLSVTETDYIFNLNEAISPIQIQSNIPTNELFASYASATSGTLDGVNFTVSALNSSSIKNYNYSNSDWNSVGQKQSIDYNFSSPTITITFESPVTNLNLYLYYFRGFGNVSYTFSEDFIVTHGLNGVPTTSSSIDASNTNFASGIIQFVNPLTTLTINRTGTTSNLGYQGFNLSKSPSLPTFTVSPSLPQGLSLNSSSGEISGTPTAGTTETAYIVTGTSPLNCTDDITLNITTNAKPSISSVDDQSKEANTAFSIPINITDQETSADNLTLTASSNNLSLINNFSISNTGSTRTVFITPENNQIGSATITLTVEDEAGATAQTSFDVTITDYPTVNTQNIDVILDSSGNANITAEDIDNGSTSISGIASLTIDQSSFSCSDINSTPSSVSLNFEGDGHIQIDGSAPLDFGGSKGFTFETQVYPRSNANSYILSKTLGGASWPGKLTTTVYINSNNQLVFGINRFSSGGWTYLSTANNTINLNEWQHIAVSYSPANSTMKIFIEGVEVTSTTLNTSYPDASPGLLRIGASETGSGQFDGYMDDFRSWENELDASEVLAVKNNNLSSVNNTLLLHYAFNTNFGTEAVDLSSTQRNGTFTGALTETSWYTGANNLNAEGVTVTLTVTSNSGDVATGTAIVSVLDDIAPILVTQNLTVELDEFGAASISAAQIDNGSSDNCGIETLALDVTTFNCSNLGQNTVTLTATDASGNQATATATVTVIDTSVPSVITQNLTVELDEFGAASISATDVDNGSSDNCGIETLALDVTTFNCSNLGENTVTITATDASGNQANATATVTVIDTSVPSVITQNLTVELDEFGAASISATDVDNGSSDNCGIETLALDVTTFNCSNLGENTVTITATDASGNQANATAVITVVDNIAPTLLTVDITVNLDANGTVSIEPSDVVDNLEDNCLLSGDITLSLDQDTFTTTGIYEVNITATDASGNSTTGSAEVTVDSTLSIDRSDLDLEIQVKLYPNPTSEKLFFEVSNAEIINITIYDMNGKLIKTSKNNRSVDVRNLSSGVYFIRCEGSDGKAFKTLRFIKK